MKSYAGTQTSNYFGSFVMAATFKLGTDSETARDYFMPVRDILPMVHPDDIIIGGWDING
jgi:myo-inositol-1-phosphate synthase